jgi:hypothetical protein
MPIRHLGRVPRGWIAVAALVLAGAIGVGVALLVSDDGGDSRAPVATSGTVATTAPTTPGTAAPVPSTEPTPNPGAPPSPEAGAPVITQFEVTPAEITCAANEVVSLTATWATRDATQVTINESGSKPPSGSEVAALRCAPGSTSPDITFTLTATGPGGTTSQTASVRVTVT